MDDVDKDGYDWLFPNGNFINTKNNENNNNNNNNRIFNFYTTTKTEAISVIPLISNMM
jgi:hypothetical protein